MHAVYFTLWISLGLGHIGLSETYAPEPYGYPGNSPNSPTAPSTVGLGEPLTKTRPLLAYFRLGSGPLTRSSHVCDRMLAKSLNGTGWFCKHCAAFDHSRGPEFMNKHPCSIYKLHKHRVTPPVSSTPKDSPPVPDVPEAKPWIPYIYKANFLAPRVPERRLIRHDPSFVETTVLNTVRTGPLPEDSTTKWFRWRTKVIRNTNAKGGPLRRVDAKGTIRRFRNALGKQGGIKYLPTKSAIISLNSKTAVKRLAAEYTKHQCACRLSQQFFLPVCSTTEEHEVVEVALPISMAPVFTTDCPLAGGHTVPVETTLTVSVHGQRMCVCGPC